MLDRRALFAIVLAAVILLLAYFAFQAVPRS